MTTTRSPYVLTIPTTQAQDIKAEPYAIPEGLEHLRAQLVEAYDMGANAARAAASWTTDGNTDPRWVSRTLRALDDGDPAADDLPFPDLSGQWADDPTPSSLARDLIDQDAMLADGDAQGGPSDINELADMLADAWEAGRDAVLSRAIEAELIGALPDPAPRAVELLDAADGSLSDALDAAEALDVVQVEQSGIVQAIYLEHLRRVGIVVRMSPHGVTIGADAGALYIWTRGSIEGLPNYGARWPCAVLADDDVDGLDVSLDARGDLTDLDVRGLHYDNADGCYYVRTEADGSGIGNGLELAADELSAFVSDVLSVVLPIDHGAWWSNVGRHLDADDVRRTTAEALRASS